MPMPHAHAVLSQAVHAHAVHAYVTHAHVKHVHVMQGHVRHAHAICVLYIRINSDMPTVAMGPKLA